MTNLRHFRLPSPTSPIRSLPAARSQPQKEKESLEHQASEQVETTPSQQPPPYPRPQPLYGWFPFHLWFRGETALHKAACQRNRAVCQLLVDAGASLRKTDSKVTWWVSANIHPLGRIAGAVAFPCAHSRGILSVPMEVWGIWGKKGKIKCFI